MISVPKTEAPGVSVINRSLGWTWIILKKLNNVLTKLHALTEYLGILHPYQMPVCISKLHQ